MCFFDEFQWISEIIGDIKNFIKNQSMRLSMFNGYSKLKFLAIAETRFASAIVMLKRFVATKDAHEKWTTYREDVGGELKASHEGVVTALPMSWAQTDGGCS
jgi:hypothetical protein